MTALRLYNTLSRQVEIFAPLEPGHVRMYSCGPTVYNFAHIGNLRTFAWCDLLRRYLQWKGFRVTMVMNLTDVEDKIIRSAQAAGVDMDTFTAPYIVGFYEDLASLRIRKADVHPRATEHIDEMVAMVQTLTERGFTYEADGSIYFKVSAMTDYGRLSQIPMDEQSSLSRVESDEYEKESARDFVLWKARKGDEPSWPTAIGDGRPGWHLECSAMSMKYLGETFDIHTGAVDLIFPHHENEIAQSECTTGKRFVRYWVHGEHLNVDQQKMSKSIGNIYTLRELLELGYPATHIRYALLSVPYRTKLNFTLRSLDDARNALERLHVLLLRLDERQKQTAVAVIAPPQKIAEVLLAHFEEAMDDDLNTAAALGALFTAVREANVALDENRMSAEEAAALSSAIRKVDEVLDFLEGEKPMLDSEIEAMIEARQAARLRRDFKESDRLRDELLARGIILEDTAQGMRWRRK